MEKQKERKHFIIIMGLRHYFSSTLGLGMHNAHTYTERILMFCLKNKQQNKADKKAIILGFRGFHRVCKDHFSFSTMSSKQNILGDL